MELTVPELRLDPNVSAFQADLNHTLVCKGAGRLPGRWGGGGVGGVWGQEGVRTRGRVSGSAAFLMAPGSHWQFNQKSSMDSEGLRILWLLESRPRSRMTDDKR